VDTLPVARRSGLSGDDLRGAIDEFRQFAETIDHRIKCLRMDVVQLAQFIHRPWEDDIDQADWWKLGGGDDESNEEDEVT
jgi:hypothetical protein